MLPVLGAAFFACFLLSGCKPEAPPAIPEGGYPGIPSRGEVSVPVSTDIVLQPYEVGDRFPGLLNVLAKEKLETKSFQLSPDSIELWIVVHLPDSSAMRRTAHFDSLLVDLASCFKRSKAARFSIHDPARGFRVVVQMNRESDNKITNVFVMEDGGYFEPPKVPSFKTGLDRIRVSLSSAEETVGNAFKIGREVGANEEYQEVSMVGMIDINGRLFYMADYMQSRSLDSSLGLNWMAYPLGIAAVDARDGSLWISAPHGGGTLLRHRSKRTQILHVGNLTVDQIWRTIGSSLNNPFLPVFWQYHPGKRRLQEISADPMELVWEMDLDSLGIPGRVVRVVKFHDFEEKFAIRVVLAEGESGYVLYQYNQRSGWTKYRPAEDLGVLEIEAVMGLRNHVERCPILRFPEDSLYLDDKKWAPLEPLHGSLPS